MEPTESWAEPANDKSHERLEALVGELLRANEELRQRVADLENEAGAAERGLKRACAPAGLLL